LFVPAHASHGEATKPDGYNVDHFPWLAAVFTGIFLFDFRWKCATAEFAKWVFGFPD